MRDALCGREGDVRSGWVYIGGRLVAVVLGNGGEVDGKSLTGVGRGFWKGYLEMGERVRVMMSAEDEGVGFIYDYAERLLHCFSYVAMPSPSYIKEAPWSYMTSKSSPFQKHCRSRFSWNATFRLEAGHRTAMFLLLGNPSPLKRPDLPTSPESAPCSEQTDAKKKKKQKSTDGDSQQHLIYPLHYPPVRIIVGAPRGVGR